MFIDRVHISYVTDLVMSIIKGNAGLRLTSLTLSIADKTVMLG